MGVEGWRAGGIGLSAWGTALYFWLLSRPWRAVWYRRVWLWIRGALGGGQGGKGGKARKIFLANRQGGEAYPGKRESTPREVAERESKSCQIKGFFEQQRGIGKTKGENDRNIGNLHSQLAESLP